MVGRRLWIPVDGRKVSIGLRDGPDVVDVYGSVPYSAMGIQVAPSAGEEQPGWLSLRAKRDGMDGHAKVISGHGR